MKLDYNKLPPLVADILTNFFHPLNLGINDLALINAINVKLAQVVNFKLVKFEGNMGTKFPNYYAINIASTGSGKDVALDLLDEKILNLFHKGYEEKISEFKAARDFEVTREAMNKFGGKVEKQRQYAAAEKDKERDFVKTNKLKTPEGLYSDALAFHNAGFGSVFVRVPEMSGLLKGGPALQECLGLLLECYEGSFLIASTKGEKASKELSNIPTNLIFYTEETSIIENEQIREKFLNYLKQGFARRCFISYQDNYCKPIIDDYSIVAKNREAAFSNARIFSEQIEILFRKIDYNMTVKTSYEAAMRYHAYTNECEREFVSIKDFENPLISVNIQLRAWKAFKLAAIIALINHVEDPEIKKEDMEMAIYQTELFTESFNSFIGTRPKDECENVIRYLLKNNGNKITRVDLKKEKFIKNSHADFSTWWKNNYEYIEQTASRKGYELKETKFGKNGYSYELVKSNTGQALTVAKPLGDFV